MSGMDESLIRRMAEEPLDPASAAARPLAQFRRWYADVRRAGVPREDAMTLATVRPDGAPAARVVLYKTPESLGVEDEGFPFFTNRESDKARELAGEPRCAVVFHWKEPGRQVRAEGAVESLPARVSDAYFASRPRGSQAGAWASPQSRAIPSRAFLEEGVRALEEKFSGRRVPRPPHWGGFVLKPRLVEFWQHRESRLHDRVRYALEANGAWRAERLAP